MNGDRMTRLTLTLDHNALRLDPDDVILYRVSPSLDRPPLFEPGPGYEPKCPAWVAALVPASDGGTDMLWARAFRLTFEARERQRLEEQRRQQEAEQARKDAIDQGARAFLRGFVAQVTGTAMSPADLPFVDLKRVVRAAGVTPWKWSTNHCLNALEAWGRREAERRLTDA